MGERPSATVAVAVVSWNTAALLDRCLASLAADVASGLAEVWVVDNGSSDGSVEVARAHGFARVVALEENTGFGRAVDHVADRTVTPWIACANADVALEPGALERLLLAARAEDRTGAVAPRLRLPDGTTQHSVHAFPGVRALAVYGSRLGRFAPRLAERFAIEGHWDPDRPRAVDWAVGAFLLVRREAWDEAGGFAAAQRLYGEDLDLGWRLRGAGWAVRYEPAAVVHHAESAATSRRWGAARHELRTVATYRWLIRRRGAPRAVAVASVAVISATLRTAVTLLRAPRDRGWKVPAAEARLHLRGIRRALRDGDPADL